MTTSVKTWAKRAAAVSVLGMGLVAASAPKAEAGTITSNFTVSTTVNTACTALTTPNLTFPTYVSGQSGPDQANTTFQITCPGASTGTPEIVTLSFAASTGPASFTMVSGANNLPYGLYQDAAYATPYVYNTPGSTISITSPTATNQVVYGQIAASQTVATGAYSQVLTATLTY